MLEGLLHLVARRPPLEVAKDVLDIAIVTYVIYRALLVLRGTRAMQMGTGLGVIFAVYVLARWAGLVTLHNMLSSLLSSIILIVVVVFQNDIRRGLMRVGTRPILAGTRNQESRVVEEIVAAATELARHRMGAIICFEQDANLDEFVSSAGTAIDAAVQRDLLVSLFVPEGVNRLHDGAVIIRNLRIALAGVFFPMPDLRMADKSFGSRHRAALGITEETDAVVVVVSEERGTISVCFNGNIIPHLDGTSLRQALLGLFGETARKAKKAKAVRPERTERTERTEREGRDGREGDGLDETRARTTRPSFFPKAPEIAAARTSIPPPPMLPLPTDRESVARAPIDEETMTRPMEATSLPEFEAEFDPLEAEK
jgi:diadenylate cyclase